jgi:hypothetical protein
MVSMTTPTTPTPKLLVTGAQLAELANSPNDPTVSFTVTRSVQ